MIAMKYSFAAGAAVVAMLTACGDEVTEVTNVDEKASLDIVEKYKELPKCEESIYGSLVYAADSSQVYACTSDGWGSLKGEKGDTGAKGDDGKAGENGTNGKDGDDGKNGESCTATALKDGSGIEVKCDGKVVGTIKNGADGAKGADGTNGTNGLDGESCTTKAVENGIEVSCPGSEPVVITNGDKGEDGKSAYELSGTDKTLEEWLASLKGDNGESCTATALQDGSGIEVMCGGKTVGTITNGTNGTDGEDGTNCNIVSDEDGVVTIQCGEGENAETTKLYKAMCGTDPFDPEKKFCVLGKLYDKCGGKAYIVNREYCKDDVVEELCTEVNRKEDGSYEVVANRALSEDEFCLAGIVTKKCGSKEFSMKEFCGKTMDGKVDSVFTFCRNPDDERLESAYQLIGKSIFPTDEDDAAFSSSSLFGNLIGPKLDDFTGDDLKKFYDALENLKTSCEEIP